MLGWIKNRGQQSTNLATFRVRGMSCGGCVRHVAGALGKLPGVDVKQVEVGKAVVSWNAGQSSEQAIVAALAAAGYEATKETSGDAPGEQNRA